MTKTVKLPRARDIMVTDVLKLAPSMDITDAVDRMLQRGVPGAPVVGQDNRLVGIVSEKDLLRVLSSAVYQSGLCGSVADYMTREVETLDPETEVFQLTYVLHDSSHRLFVVIDRDRAVLGVLARHDLLRALHRIWRTGAKVAAHPTTYETLEKRLRG